MSKENKEPLNTGNYGRDNKGRFTEGNKGRPPGATNKTTRDIREFITDFLNDKAFEIPHIWEAMDDKDKATLYLHLCRLVLPKPPEKDEVAPLPRPSWIPEIDFKNITTDELKMLLNEYDEDDEPKSNRPIIQFSEPKISKEQIDKLIDKL